GTLSQILNFAREVNAREIEIVGHRGAVLLSHGRTMVEEPTIGKQRAEQVSMLLQGANLKEPTFTVKWVDEPAKATGVDDYLSRRVVVTVRPRPAEAAPQGSSRAPAAAPRLRRKLIGLSACLGISSRDRFEVDIMSRLFGLVVMARRLPSSAGNQGWRPTYTRSRFLVSHRSSAIASMPKASASGTSSVAAAACQKRDRRRSPGTVPSLQ